MFEAVILAAGYSSRAGSNKMGLIVQGKPVLGRVIEAFVPLCTKITIVGGHYYKEVVEIASTYDSVRLVKNEDYDLGMFSSILCGVQNVESDCFICPGDYPLVDKDLVAKLSEAKGDFVVPVFEGKRGHPVLLNKKTVEKLKMEPRDSNLKIFRDKCKMTEVVVASKGILIDLDTKEDYETIKNMSNDERSEIS